MEGFYFTNRVRERLSEAREEAIRLRHDDVTTQHILLAVLRENSSVAADVIESFGVKLEDVARSLEQTIKLGPEPYEARADVPFSPRAKKVLELAMAEGRGLNHSHIGTHHVLLGLIREEKGVAARVLAEFGIELAAARTQVLRSLSSGKQDDDTFPRRTVPAGATRVATELASGSMAARPNSPTAGTTAMAASIIAALLHDAGIAGVFAAQRIDAGILIAALRSAALRPPMSPPPST